MAVWAEKLFYRCAGENRGTKRVKQEERETARMCR